MSEVEGSRRGSKVKVEGYQFFKAFFTNKLVKDKL